MSDETGRAAGDVGRVLAHVGACLAMAAMLVLFPFFLASGLVAPLWAVVVIMAIWLGLAGVGILLLLRRRPLLVLPVPVLAALLWWLIISVGGHFLGWTA